MTYNFRSDCVILLGDTHSHHTLYEMVIRIPKDSDLISLGDNGFAFGEDRVKAIYYTDNMLKLINDFCKCENINLYILIGNHDAPYPEIWDKKWSNIFLTKSGDYGIFPNGKKALLVGGGISVDRCSRKQNIDYWSEEITPYITDIDKCDYLLSHDCPEEFNHQTNSLYKRFQWALDKDPTLLEDCKKQRNNMTRILKECGAEELYHAHMHNNITQTIDGVYGRCVDINELYFLDTNHERTN